MDNGCRWLPVSGYRGQYRKYMVSDTGLVKSVPVSDSRSMGRPSAGGKLLTPKPMTSGHHQVGLRVNGRTENVLVHRLVALAFLGNPADGQEVRHLNGDPSDNRMENLRWGTRSENMLDRVGHGTHSEASKTHCRRNHPLVEPNLRKSESVRGGRGCLACHRADSYIRWHGLDRSGFQAVADSYFDRLSA